MKKILTILLLAVSLVVHGTKYYVAPTTATPAGNDATGNGSIGSPWFELEKAWPSLSPGDTLYLRGGTYQFNDSQGLTGKSGTAGNYINVWAYPGETPVLTISGSYAQNELIDVVGDYLYWKGIDISGFAQRPADTYAYAALRFTDSDNCLIELLNYHHNMGGLRIKGASTGNLILNCDFHHIYDPYTSYGDGDGCDIAEVAAGSINTVRGCRFWRNADDGLDLWDNDGYVTIDGCWSWMNGYQEDGSTIGGDGAGFKMGATATLDSTTFQRTIQNCVAFDNRQFGISQNGALCKHYVYNNTVFRNLYRGIYFSSSWGLSPHVITNNIAYNNTTNTVITEAAILTTNSWYGFTVTNDDFVSIDTTGVSGPRQSDGSLPALPFLRLKSNSDLVNAGTNVGISYTDSAPDIGAYESSTTLGDWYIEKWGSDTHGKGTLDDPWLTLKHATDTVTGANFVGDTIMVGVGTFTETQRSALGVGVSIYGAGATSIITTAAALDPIILLSSATQGTVGNQSISYIKMDGDLTALTLIKNFARSNVKIHHCEFIDAVEDGVQFYGRADELYQFTTTYSTGNEFYNNTVTNCSKFEVYDTWRYIHGCFAFGGQDGMLIHDNIITQPDRGGAANGAAITFTNRGNHKGTKIYNNTLYTPPKKAETGGGYAFAIEIWSQRGGVEIYDNDITGAIDVGGYDTNDDGGYGYALKIYRNTIGIPALSAYNHYLLHLELGIHDGTFIYQNYFYNASRPVTFSTTSSALVQGQEDIYFYYNIFNNVRKAGDGWFGYCFDINPSVAVTIHNLQILNNTVYAPASSLYAFIQSNDATTTFTDMIVRNNIVINAHACVEITNGTVTGINVDNNNFYNTSHQTDYTGSTVTGNTLANNITSDPLFVSTSDLHLQSTSPCRDAGIDVSAITGGKDFHGASLYGAAYDIGAFEYQGTGRVLLIIDDKIATINYKIPLIDH